MARIISDISNLYPAYAIALIVNFFTKYNFGDSITPLYLIMGVWILTATIRQIGQYSSSMIGFRVATRANLDAQLYIMKHLFSLDMDWHEKENSGNKMKRIDKGSSGIENILRIWISNFIEIPVFFIGTVLIISQFSLSIGGTMVFYIISFYLLSTIYRKRGVAASRVVSIQDEHLNGLIFESINNIRTVKVLSMAKNIFSALTKETEDLFHKIMKRIFWFQTGGRLLQTYSTVFHVSLIIFIIQGIIIGNYEVGFLILFYNYFSRIWFTISEFTDLVDKFATHKNDVHRMQELLDVPVNIDIEDGKVLMAKDWQKMQVKNLFFSYGNKKVLDNISFEIERGKKVGIVGLSGAGKSTLFKLLLKENESYEGEILFDDIPLRNISKKDYLKHTAVVLQETELFNVSLRQNIAIGKESNSEDLLSKAIEVAHVKDFMDKLPAGEESIVGEKGIKLSGGEKQRVGIARAVYKEPELLLMDEATSHLDIESEKKIQDSLHEFFKQVTAVVIAHRLTTIKEMDKIIVIEEGKIVESGSFAELQDKRGRFFELWEKQRL